MIDSESWAEVDCALKEMNQHPQRCAIFESSKEKFSWNLLPFALCFWAVEEWNIKVPFSKIDMMWSDE